MTIKAYPEDLIKLGVWDNYTYYVIGSDKEAEKILAENLEFELSETDGLVIGLLRVVETSNIIHRLNNYVDDFLVNKTINNNGALLIRKKALIACLEKFFNKYPDYWTDPKKDYVFGIEEAKKYYKLLSDDIDKIDIIQLTDKFGTHDFLNSNSVRKLLKFNY